MKEYEGEDLDKLKAVDKALKELHGVLIPYNLIVDLFAPLQRWLNLVLRGNEKAFGR